MTSKPPSPPPSPVLPTGAGSHSVATLEEILSSEELSADYESFCVEKNEQSSFCFVQAVRSYKLFFRDRASNWQVARAKLLFSTYIASGAEKEVGVSNETRDKLRAIVEEEGGDPKALETAFDQAETQVEETVLVPLLSEFLTRPTSTLPRMGSNLSTWAKHALLKQSKPAAAPQNASETSLVSCECFSVPTMAEMLSDPELLAQFEEFCHRRLVLESLHFVQDVAEFKRFFYDKADNWKAQKARLIYQTYMEVGSPKEVNVSFEVRDKTRLVVDPSEDEPKTLPKRMESVFDRTFLDIEHSLINPLLIEFASEQHSHNKEESSAARRSMLEEKE